MEVLALVFGDAGSFAHLYKYICSMKMNNVPYLMDHEQDLVTRPTIDEFIQIQQYV